MGFNKRFIGNNQVLTLFADGGAINVFNWYTKKHDALITEVGLASDILEIIDHFNFKLSSVNQISKRIEKELNLKN